MPQGSRREIGGIYVINISKLRESHKIFFLFSFFEGNSAKSHGKGGNRNYTTF